ncbi:excalibur calcium-binding domain-containing protein [Arthrobacter crusticola]|uniref:Excalibur calcium-binding domain-containing protein n=1 Tax=Arthrobacter crusticola TaxID=2547960 RepID=A0A4R5TZF7_9MICC|nr:excalibur calcium-binding domain-containing protein [Arthrobacter crusticola]
MGIKVKKSSAILAVAAAAGFTALSASPATAAVTIPFANCDAAAAVGVYNIPAGTPGYQPKLDADSDGFGCDAAGTPAYDASIVDRIIMENNQPAPVTPPQVPTMPVGGVGTGVVQEPANDNTGTLVLGGGLVLAVAAGGTYLVRRRSTGSV